MGSQTSLGPSWRNLWTFDLLLAKQETELLTLNAHNRNTPAFCDEPPFYAASSPMEDCSKIWEDWVPWALWPIANFCHNHFFGIVNGLVTHFSLGASSISWRDLSSRSSNMAAWLFDKGGSLLNVQFCGAQTSVFRGFLIIHGIFWCIPNSTLKKCNTSVELYVDHSASSVPWQIHAFEGMTSVFPAIAEGWSLNQLVTKGISSLVILTFWYAWLCLGGYEFVSTLAFAYSDR